MECISTWPLLQRNKIEDSKINVAVQAIADVPLPDDEVAKADTPVKPKEETPKPPELEAEPSEPTDPDPTQTDANRPRTIIKSGSAEAVDAPIPTESANGVTAMTVDEPEPDLGSERGRAPERLESQAAKLKRLATKVLVSWIVPPRC